jgi:hypothetical protein
LWGLGHGRRQHHGRVGAGSRSVRKSEEQHLENVSKS